MSRLTVEVPQSLLDETAKKEIAALKRQVAKLERQLAELNATKEKAKAAVAAFTALRSYLAEGFDLYEDYGF